MRPFELIEPKSINDACLALEANPYAKVIAGGTALLILIKQGVYPAETLINLRKIPGQTEITFEPNTGLRIGALASIHDVDTHPIVRERFPALSEACHVVANIRIRNAATIGGNVAHADYQSDPPTALIALGASVELASSSGVRAIALSEFLLGAYETTLGSAEVVTALLVPPPDLQQQSAYLKFTTRSSEDRPAVGAAAVVWVEDRRLVDLRIVVGAVTPTPSRLTAVEDVVRGRKLDLGSLGDVAQMAADSIEPIDDLRGSANYKRQVAGVLVERALGRCLEQGVTQ